MGNENSALNALTSGRQKLQLYHNGLLIVTQ